MLIFRMHPVNKNFAGKNVAFIASRSGHLTTTKYASIKWLTTVFERTRVVQFARLDSQLPLWSISIVETP